MASKTISTRKGVRLTLGGAPDVWHVIVGIGLVHPTIVRPITEDEVLFVEGAECLEVAKLTDSQAAKAQEDYDDAREVSRGAVKDAKHAGAASPIEAEQISDEAQAAEKELD